MLNFIFERLYFSFVFYQLNSFTADESRQQQQHAHKNRIPSEHNSDNSDEEDQAYKDFLSRTIESSDADDDEDFVPKLNGDDGSDTDSQSSIATEDMSNDEIDIYRSGDVSILP